jgi:hypothetical protein
VKNRFQNLPFKCNLQRYTAGGGHLETLKYLRENNCPWDTMACAYAAEGGHLELLEWVGLCVALHDAHWSALRVCTNDMASFRLRPIGVRVCGADLHHRRVSTTAVGTARRVRSPQSTGI